MIKARTTILQALSRYALPILYVTVIMRLIIDTYMPDDITTYTIACLAAECGLFALFEWLKNKKIMRVVVYILLSVLVGYVFSMFISAGFDASRKSYMDWFYVDSQTVGRVDQYFYGTMIFMAYFLTSIVYYFTMIRYRASGTMLAMLYPLFIYAKRADTIPDLELTVLITVFLALMVHSRLMSAENKSRVMVNRQYAAAVALFVAVVGAVTMFLPGTDAKSKLEADKTYFDLTFRNRSDYDELSDLSSLRFGSNDEGVELFRMVTDSNDTIHYLRRQGFDRIIEKERWEEDRDFNDNFNLENMHYSENELNSPYFMYYTMQDLAKTGRYTDLGLDQKYYPDDLYSEPFMMHLYTMEEFSPRYMPAPLTVDVVTIKDHYKIPHGEIYPKVIYDNQEAPELNFSFDYFSDEDDAGRLAQEQGLSQTDFLHILDAAVENGDLEPEVASNVTKLLGYYTDLSGYAPSKKLTKLSEDITKDCETDYDKAKAIEHYFEESGFRYDKEYVPKDESIDYFLFTSKRGSCTSYATSMTLLARLSGLPARYVEGFAAFDRDKNNEYIIRDSHAHAWVEVYISGYGWMTFDPTPSSYQLEFNDGGGSVDFSWILKYLGRIAVVIGVVVVIVFVLLLDLILELCFRISLRFKNNTERILRLYRRTLKLLEASSGEKLSGYTPHELLEFMKDKRGAELSVVIELFEYTCFGGHEPTDEEWEKAYSVYKTEFKKLRKQRAENKNEAVFR